MNYVIFPERSWIVLQEAIEFAMPSEIRYLFVNICLFSEPFNPLELWLKYRETLKVSKY